MVEKPTSREAQPIVVENGTSAKSLILLSIHGDNPFIHKKQTNA